MSKGNALAVFENFKIRRMYDEHREVWYFSVVDIVAALIQQPDYRAARNYWKVMKNLLKKEGSESVTKCNRLKMLAADGILLLRPKSKNNSRQHQGAQTNAKTSGTKRMHVRQNSLG